MTLSKSPNFFSAIMKSLILPLLWSQAVDSRENDLLGEKTLADQYSHDQIRRLSHCSNQNASAILIVNQNSESLLAH